MFHPTSLEDGKLAKAEEIISYRFANRLGLRRALQLADSIHQNGNKDLALLGDTVIRLILVKEGLRRDATRGQINNVVSEKLSNAYLAQRGFFKGLAECVFANRSQGNTVYPGPMASTVEAIVGAVFNDSGEKMTVVQGVMEALGISWPE
ncbi:RNAse III [Aspergillus steynii IBT 23096]|uniref:RNAse III n=1 Tax=Aspergillus steynii IBT 23096 TaxID=1392250 RepID=A0A2I2GPG0_9EURO|nr:RNAse III [Aspergillus steynii IBT 23096]PLB54759.1 RNAse III [Aspergillus steynii IBT 23096]